jgi:hypothetical protein
MFATSSGTVFVGRSLPETERIQFLPQGRKEVKLAKSLASNVQIYPHYSQLARPILQV